MEKTNFENLDIYKLSEKIADEIWEIVIKWNNLAQVRLGNRLSVLPTVSAQISPKEADAELRRITDGFYEWREAHYMKQDIGCAALTKENFYLRKIPKNFYLSSMN